MGFEQVSDGKDVFSSHNVEIGCPGDLPVTNKSGHIALLPAITASLLATATPTACPLLMAFVLLWMQRQPVADFREGHLVTQAA